VGRKPPVTRLRGRNSLPAQAEATLASLFPLSRSVGEGDRGGEGVPTPYPLSPIPYTLSPTPYTWSRGEVILPGTFTGEGEQQGWT